MPRSRTPTRTRTSAAGPISVVCVRNTTHELLGVTLSLAASRALELDELASLPLVAGAVYGSWLPDADRLGSRVHRRTRLERRSLLVAAAGTLARLPLLAFALLARHRGVSHSLLACASLAALATTSAVVALGAGLTAALAGLALGYAAHVMADACTPAGVELWRPFSRRCVRLLPVTARIPTGSLREGLVAVGAAVLALTLALTAVA